MGEAFLETRKKSRPKTVVDKAATQMLQKLEWDATEPEPEWTRVRAWQHDGHVWEVGSGGSAFYLISRSRKVLIVLFCATTSDTSLRSFKSLQDGEGPRVLSRGRQIIAAP